MPAADVDFYRCLLDLLRVQFRDYRPGLELGPPLSGRRGTIEQATAAKLDPMMRLMREGAIVGPSYHLRGEYSVAVSLAVSLGLIVLSLIGWWWKADLDRVFERLTTWCC